MRPGPPPPNPHTPPPRPFPTHTHPPFHPFAAREFVRQCCLLLGQAQDSPLLVTAAAGAAALPTLLKLATVISDKASSSCSACKG